MQRMVGNVILARILTARIAHCALAHFCLLAVGFLVLFRRVLPSGVGFAVLKIDRVEEWEMMYLRVATVTKVGTCLIRVPRQGSYSKASRSQGNYCAWKVTQP